MATPSPSPSSHTLNLYGVLSESKRIINAHSRHFLALSVLFLLPLSFSLIIYPTIHSILSQPNSIFNHPQHTLLFLSYPSPPSLFPILYTIFAVLLSVFAFATISYSTFHGFYGRPVKIKGALYSLLCSFLPLTMTLVVAEWIACLVGFGFLFIAGLVFKGLEVAGVGISYDSMYFTFIYAFVAVMFILSVIYLHVNWILTPVIVVVERKWGYGALRRSAGLVRGMRGLVLSMMVLFGLSVWFFTWACSGSVVDVGGVLGWESLVFIFEMVISSGIVTMLMLEGMAAVAVLYMYCKAVRGELVLEIVEEFGSDYISLPFDDEKVPHVVSVAYG